MGGAGHQETGDPEGMGQGDREVRGLWGHNQGQAGTGESRWGSLRIIRGIKKESNWKYQISYSMQKTNSKWYMTIEWDELRMSHMAGCLCSQEMG